MEFNQIKQNVKYAATVFVFSAVTISLILGAVFYLALRMKDQQEKEVLRVVAGKVNESSTQLIGKCIGTPEQRIACMQSALGEIKVDEQKLTKVIVAIDGKRTLKDIKNVGGYAKLEVGQLISTCISTTMFFDSAGTSIWFSLENPEFTISCNEGRVHVYSASLDQATADNLYRALSSGYARFLKNVR